MSTVGSTARQSKRDSWVLLVGCETSAEYTDGIQYNFNKRDTLKNATISTSCRSDLLPILLPNIRHTVSIFHQTDAESIACQLYQKYMHSKNALDNADKTYYSIYIVSGNWYECAS